MALFYVGFDPGVSGAVSIIQEGGYLLECRPIPLAGSMIDAEAVARIMKLYDTKRMFAMIERAQAMPKQGVSSMFNYGTSYGILIGVVSCLCGFSLVPPRRWQSLMFQATPDDLDTKARSAMVARRLWPSEPFLATPKCRKLHSGMTDSALIAEYARMTHGEGR